MKNVFFIVVGFVLLLSGCPSATDSETGKFTPPEWLVGTAWSGNIELPFGEFKIPLPITFKFTKDDVLFSGESSSKNFATVKDSYTDKMYEFTGTTSDGSETYKFVKNEGDDTKLSLTTILSEKTNVYELTKVE